MSSAVEHIMGTVFSLAVPRGMDTRVFRTAAGVAFAYPRHVDAVFSPYRPDSAISLIADGFHRLDSLDDHPRGAEIRECARLKRLTDGAYDAWAAAEPPGFEPSGAVKGWAADQASALLVRHGCDRHILKADGDVLLDGGAPADPWRVALADPHRPHAVLAVTHLHRGGVATSGTAESGAHVFDPLSGRRATTWHQVTVTGADLTLADGYATAALAMAEGRRGTAGTRAWLRKLAADRGYQSLVVDACGRLWMTNGMDALLDGSAVPASTSQEG